MELKFSEAMADKMPSVIRSPISLLVPVAALAAGLLGAADAGAEVPPNLPPASATTQSAIGDVLMVGDSLAVGTAPYLEKELRGPNVRANGEVGRSSIAGLGVLEAELKPGDDVIVFDLGTNDDPSQPDQLLSDFEAARTLIGDRCMIVATLNRPDYNGVPIDGMNAMITRFAAADPTVQVVDWHDAARGDPELVEGDGVHTTPAGYAARAELMAEAVAACPPSLADRTESATTFEFSGDEDADATAAITFDGGDEPNVVDSILGLLADFARTVTS